MRILLLINLVLLVSLKTDAQLPEKLKYDELIYSKDSSRVLIHYKKKSAVYSFVDSTFICPINKNQIFYIPGSDCFAEISHADGRITLHFLITDKNVKTTGSVDLSNVLFRSDSTVSMNGLVYDIRTRQFATELYFDGRILKRITVEKLNGQFIIINDFEIDDFSNSLDASGVYDLNIKKWVVEPSYQSCHRVNDFIFCLKRVPIEVSENEYGPYFEWSYDLYQLNGGELINLKSNIRFKNELDLTSIFNADAVTLSTDSSIYVIEKNGKQGLVYFNLFSLWDSRYSDFEYSEVLLPLADYVYFSSEESMIAAVYKDSIDKVALYQFIDYDGDYVYAGEDDSVGTYRYFNNAANFLVADPKRVSFSYQLQPNDSKWNVSANAGACHYQLNNVVYRPEFVGQGYSPRANFGFDLVNDSLLIVNAFKENLIGPAYDEVGENLIDEGGNFVYEIYEPHWERSGVRNIKTGEWIIEPLYQQCFSYENFIFCFKRIENPEETFVCDIYEVSNQSAKKMHADIQRNGLIDIAPFFEAEHSEICSDSIHYVIVKDGTKSFVHFQLFETASSFFYDFECKRLENLKADFLYFSPAFQKIIAVNRDSVNRVSLYEYNNYSPDWEKPTLIISGKSNVGFGSPESPPLRVHEYVFNESSYFSFWLRETDFKMTEYANRNNKTANVGAHLVNDSLLIINDFLLDEFHLDYPMYSIEYPGEDSLRYNPVTGEDEVVYYPPTPGYDRSFIYNLNSGKLILLNSAQYVDATGNGFLIRNAIRNSEFGTISGYDYSFVEFDGSQVFEHKTTDELMVDLNLLRYCVRGFAADSLFEAPNGVERHSSAENADKNYYVVSGNKLAMYNPNSLNGQFWNETIVEPEEFVHLLPELSVKIWLADDSIFFTSAFDSVSVNQKSGKIVYWHSQNLWNSENDYRLLIIENDDTTIIGTATSVIGNYAFVSIEKRSDLLIINDCTISGPDYWYNSRFGQILLNRNMESENSAVWKLQNGRWQKITPYYALISPIPSGYIAKSGKYSIHYDAENDDAWLEPQVEDDLRLEIQTINVESRYFILDSNLNVKPCLNLSDFPLIEDLGFGLKVCYDNGGCFFMTYDYQALTDPSWDYFELYEGKLKAIKNEQPMIDEYGDQMYDDNGAPLMISESVIMFFEIP